MGQFKSLAIISIFSVFLHGFSQIVDEAGKIKSACVIHGGKPEDPNDPGQFIVMCDNIGFDGRSLDDVLNKEPLLDASTKFNKPKTYPIDKIASRVRTNYITALGALNIPKGTFSNLAALEHLDIDGGISVSGNRANLSIFKDELANLPHLHELRISHMVLSNDAVEALRSIINRVNKLIIAESTPNQAFLELLPQFTNLTEVTLFSVNDETPEDAKNTLAFGKSAGKLESISLNKANITKLQKRLLRGLVNLKVLLIQNSSVQEVEPGAFDELPNLEVIDLTNNKLSSLPSGLFDKNPKLERVTLYNNYNITNISPANFTNHKNFKRLELKEIRLIPL